MVILLFIYELLTGKFLFEEIQDNYMGFIVKIDNSNNINDLLTNDKLSLINNNPYLVDFLKFMLIKEQNYHPNIETVIKRFEHVYTLLDEDIGTYIKNNFIDNDLKKFILKIVKIILLIKKIYLKELNQYLKLLC